MVAQQSLADRCLLLFSATHSSDEGEKVKDIILFFLRGVSNQHGTQPRRPQFLCKARSGFRLLGSKKNFVTVLISIASGLNVQVVTKHIHLELEVDFHARVLHGHVLLSVERVDPAASTLLLDISRLQIDSVQVDICCPSSPPLEFLVLRRGSLVLIWLLRLGPAASMEKSWKFHCPPRVNNCRWNFNFNELLHWWWGQVKVRYRTMPTSTALQWLEPEQTLAGTHPFLFSQCQATHNY